MLMRILVVAVLLVTPLGCGGEPKADPKATVTVTAPASPSATAVAVSKEALKRALVRLADLPAGYREEAVSVPAGAFALTPCRRPLPDGDKFIVGASRRFITGGGFTEQIAAATLYRYKTAAQARKVIAGVQKIAAKCKVHRFNGIRVVYSVISTGELGDTAVGVSADAGDEGNLYQYWTAIGPTVSVVGTSGIVSTDSALALELARLQVGLVADSTP